MVKSLLTFIIGLIAIYSSFSQTYFSCSFREICEWNPSTELFDICKGYEEASLFKMNDDETLFTHITDDQKSTYFINSKEYDSENDIFIYDVRSDVGNKYIYIFDPDNNQIRVLIFYADSSSKLVRFIIKKMWID